MRLSDRHYERTGNRMVRITDPVPVVVYELRAVRNSYYGNTSDRVLGAYSTLAAAQRAAEPERKQGTTFSIDEVAALRLTTATLRHIETIALPFYWEFRPLAAQPVSGVQSEHMTLQGLIDCLLPGRAVIRGYQGELNGEWSALGAGTEMRTICSRLTPDGSRLHWQRSYRTRFDDVVETAIALADQLSGAIA